jgi:hypothetical protein
MTRSLPIMLLPMLGSDSRLLIYMSVATYIPRKFHIRWNVMLLQSIVLIKFDDLTILSTSRGYAPISRVDKRLMVCCRWLGESLISVREDSMDHGVFSPRRSKKCSRRRPRLKKPMGSTIAPSILTSTLPPTRNLNQPILRSLPFPAKTKGQTGTRGHSLHPCCYIDLYIGIAYLVSMCTESAREDRNGS